MRKQEWMQAAPLWFSFMCSLLCFQLYLSSSKPVPRTTVRPLRNADLGDVFKRVHQQPVTHFSSERRFRRNSARNHEVEKRDVLLAVGTKDEIKGGRQRCGRSLVSVG